MGLGIKNLFGLGREAEAVNAAKTAGRLDPDLQALNNALKGTETTVQNPRTFIQPDFEPVRTANPTSVVGQPRRGMWGNFVQGIKDRPMDAAMMALFMGPMAFDFISAPFKAAGGAIYNESQMGDNMHPRSSISANPLPPPYLDPLSKQYMMDRVHQEDLMSIYNQFQPR